MTRKEKKHCKLFIKKHVNVSWQIITRLVSIMRCVVPPFYAPARCGDGRWETKCRHIPCRDPVNGAQLEVDLMYIACLDLKFMYHECLILIAKRVWLEWNVTFRVVDVLALLLELVMIPLGVSLALDLIVLSLQREITIMYIPPLDFCRAVRIWFLYSRYILVLTESLKMELWQDLISVTTTPALVSTATFSYTNERLFVFFRREDYVGDLFVPKIGLGMGVVRQIIYELWSYFRFGRWVANRGNATVNDVLFFKGVWHVICIYIYIYLWYLCMSCLSRFAPAADDDDDDDADVGDDDDDDDDGDCADGDDDHEFDYDKNHVDDPNVNSHCGAWCLAEPACQKSQDWWKFMLSKGLLSTNRWRTKQKLKVATRKVLTLRTLTLQLTGFDDVVSFIYPIFSKITRPIKSCWWFEAPTHPTHMSWWIMHLPVIFFCQGCLTVIWTAHLPHCLIF